MSTYLNSGSGFESTTPVGRFPLGKSSHGLYDVVGNTFRVDLHARRIVLKGCSWDDLPGACGAAQKTGGGGKWVYPG